MKALNFFCFEHNDKTEPNLSWFLMQIDQFGKWKFSRSEYIHPSRRDKTNLLPTILNNF